MTLALSAVFQPCATWPDGLSIAGVLVVARPCVAKASLAKPKPQVTTVAVERATVLPCHPVAVSRRSPGDGCTGCWVRVGSKPVVLPSTMTGYSVVV